MVAPQHESANSLIKGRIKELAKVVEDLVDADFYAYSGPMAQHTPDLFKDAIETADDLRTKALIWLETDGGYVEATERVVNVLRHHYDTVDFAVTTYAMSAGTILTMSGDSIFMDYSATLGPIDPQVMRPDGRGFVPAVGYLEQWERLVDKSNSGDLTSAELAFMVETFDAAELYQFEQARDLSIALLEDWLATYKFKSWTVTQSSGTPVTEEMRRERAREIATQLNDTSDWHSHSRGISMAVLRDKLNLQIDDIEDTPELHEALSRYLALLFDFRQKMGHDYFVIASSEDYHGH